MSESMSESMEKMRDTLHAIMEGERNAAADGYFNARPQVDRTIERERLFEAGFLRGFTAGRASSSSDESGESHGQG